MGGNQSTQKQKNLQAQKTCKLYRQVLGLKANLRSGEATALTTAQLYRPETVSCFRLYLSTVLPWSWIYFQMRNTLGFILSSSSSSQKLIIGAGLSMSQHQAEKTRQQENKTNIN